MFELFSLQSRNILLEYPFVRDFFNADRNWKSFSDDLKQFKEEILIRIPTDERELFNEFCLLFKNKKANKQWDCMQNYKLKLNEEIAHQYPEVLRKYPLSISLYTFKQSTAIKSHIFYGFTKEKNYPIFTIFIYSQHSSELLFRLLYVNNDDVLKMFSEKDRLTGVLFRCDVENYFKFIDGHDQEFGNSNSKELKQIMVDHILLLRRVNSIETREYITLSDGGTQLSHIDFLNKLNIRYLLPVYDGNQTGQEWYWYGSLPNENCVWLAGQSKTYAYKLLFKDLIYYYKIWNQNPDIRRFILLPFIRKVFYDFHKIWDSKPPKTLFQQKEFEIFFSGYIQPVSRMLNIEY